MFFTSHWYLPQRSVKKRSADTGIAELECLLPPQAGDTEGRLRDVCVLVHEEQTTKTHRPLLS
jgi:hypothetical protein